jgi:predicted phage tail protein
MRKVLTAFCLTILAIGLLPTNNAFALDVPTGFAATGNRGGTFTSGTVTLSWSPVTGADNGYAVQTLLNGNQVGDLAGVIGQSTNNLVVSGLQGGSEYTFKIRSISTSAVSSWSAAVTATPVTAPATPPKPTHSVSRLTATVNWSAPLSDGGSAITGYLVTEANSGVTQTASSSARSVQFENLTAGEKIKFNVSAINTVLASGTVSANSDETTLANVPGQVTGVGVAATSVADEIRITWTNPSNGGSDLTQTKVYLVSAGNDVQTATLANTSLTTHTFSGVSSGSYTAQVQSVNIIGSGSRSIAPTAVSITGVVTPSSGGGGGGGGGGPAPTPTPSVTPSPSPSPSTSKSPTPASTNSPKPSPSTSTGKPLSKPTTFTTSLPKTFTSAIATSKVVDAKGNTIKNVKVSISKSGKVSAVFPKGTKPGTYSLKVTGKNKKTTTVKIVVK